MKAIEHIPAIPSDGVVIRPEGGVVRIFFDIARIEDGISGDDEKMPEDLCTCINIDVAVPASYGSVVAAVVSDRFSSDDVQALVANYTASLGDDDLPPGKQEEYQSEWMGYQEWRKKAKEIAQIVVNRLTV